MKRYAVFAYTQYYPSGGINDFKKSFDNRDDAQAFAAELADGPYANETVELIDMQEYGNDF